MEKQTMALYPINIESAPNWVILKAFEKAFDTYHYDWVNISNEKGLYQTQLDFLEYLKQNRPEYCFMQLQNPINMSVEMIREMAKYTKTMIWSGDVRTNPEWYDWNEAMGKEAWLMLYSNDTDTDIMRQRGVKSHYLQVGFDNVFYDKKTIQNSVYPEIVFCCNDYGAFELSQYRVDVVKALISKYGDRFKIYGSGWDKHGVNTLRINNTQEAEAYNTAKICISVSNFKMKSYFSDRLLRILACGGGVAISHDFPDTERHFTENKHLVVFNNTTELIEKCNYYLNNEAERKAIVENAYNEVHTNHTWDKRMEELKEIIKKYEN